MKNLSFKIMGIVNITNDSFFSDSCAYSEDEILKRISTLIKEGADIIDIGACSTRPGSVAIDSEEEWRRIEIALKAIKKIKGFSATEGSPARVELSIDTFRAEIVERSYQELEGCGVSITINDISAGEDDPKMLPTVGKLGLKYIAMHKRGDSVTMSSLCEYNDLVGDIVEYFREFEIRAAAHGIKEWILDPGFGFAKTIEQNYELLERLEEFNVFGREILVGISRKSFIYKPLGLGPEDVLEATTELHKKIIKKNGAFILRVHDVAPLRDI